MVILYRLENLFSFKTIVYEPYTAKGTIKSVKFDIPSGCSILNVIVTGRFQTYDLTGFKYKNYKETTSHFSYSYDNQGNVWVSNTFDTESAGRLAEVFIVFTKS